MSIQRWLPLQDEVGQLAQGVDTEQKETPQCLARQGEKLHRPVAQKIRFAARLNGQGVVGTGYCRGYLGCEAITGNAN